MNQAARNLWDFRREFDRFFDEFWGDGAPSSVDMGLEERGDHYLLQLEVPGMAKENVKVEVMGNQLIVEGKRDERRPSQGRRHAEFRRVVTLPANIDSSRVEASLEHGILEIEMPKAAAALPRRIEIGAKAKSVGIMAPASEHQQKFEASGDSERVAS